MNKHYELIEDFERFIDSEGNVKLYATTPDDKRDNGNTHLYNAYALMVAEGYEKSLSLAGLRAFAEVKGNMIEPGLFQRHKTHTDTISHDEYNGIVAIDVHRHPHTPIVHSIVSYGIEHDWQFNDKQPGKYHPIYSIRSWYRFATDKSYRQFALSELLRYRRLPRDTFFYKAASGGRLSLVGKRNYGLFELLWFCAALVVTGLKDPRDYANGSSQLMACLRLWVLGELSMHKKDWFSRFMLRSSYKIFFRLQNASDSYLNFLMRMHFKDQGHFFLKYSKHLDVRTWIDSL